MRGLGKSGIGPRRFAASCEGSVAILLAASMIVILWCVAFAVDAGSLYFERRAAQGATDLAAIAAARDAGRAEQAARATLEANGHNNLTFLSVVPGHYTPDPALPPDRRFAAGANPANAVEVRMRRNVPLYFAGRLLGVDAWEVGAKAVAVTTAQAAFSIGSRLARLEGGVLNALLGTLLGGSLTLSVMDYEALAQTNVKLFHFLDALATEFDLTAASYSDILAAELSSAQVMNALAVAAAAAGADAASGVLRQVAASAGDAPVPLARMLDLGPYGSIDPAGPAPAFAPQVNVMDMVSAAASVANGDNQARVNLGAAVPGLADVHVDLAIGERPQGSSWLTIGTRGAVVRTAQTRLKLSATVGGGSLLAGIALRIPLYLELAYAQARLEELSCGAEPRRDARVRIAARPGVADLWLAEADPAALDDFSGLPALARARLVDSTALRVTAFSNATAGSGTATRLTFDWDDIENGRIKRTATRDATAELLRSLVRNSDLDVTTLGLSLVPPAVLRSAVAELLATAATPLSRVLDGVLEGLGVKLGEADVMVHGLRCDGSVLVG